MNPYSDYALPLAKCLGFYISPPIPVGAKKPIWRWKQYQSCPAQEQEILNWSKWRDSKNNNHPFNYGILTGTHSGFVVVEADSEDAVRFVIKHCTDKTPLIQRSGSRKGAHFVYRYPLETDCFIKTQAKIKIGGVKHDIDIRGVGGLAVGPGCLHKSGNRYQMLKDWRTVRIEDVPYLEPEWLQLDTEPPRVFTGSDAKLDTPLDDRLFWCREYLRRTPGAKEGNGAEGYAYAIACEVIHGFALSPEEAFPFYQEWGNRGDQVCKSGGWYPWDDKDLFRKLYCAADEVDAQDRSDGYRLDPCKCQVDPEEVVKVLTL